MRYGPAHSAPNPLQRAAVRSSAAGVLMLWIVILPILVPVVVLSADSLSQALMVLCIVSVASFTVGWVTAAIYRARRPEEDIGAHYVMYLPWFGSSADGVDEAVSEASPNGSE